MSSLSKPKRSERAPEAGPPALVLGGRWEGGTMAPPSGKVAAELEATKACCGKAGWVEPG